MFSACEGPEGPEGPAGKAGQNALATCDNCHDVSTELKSKMLQYANSTHALGGNFDRNSISCAPCHTHEGFMEVLETGANATAAPIMNSTPPGCRTCHNIHTTYSVDDYALTTTKPVELMFGSATYDKGNSNLCANCHQSRPVSPMPDFNDAEFTIGNYRFGPHHGPQSNVMLAAGFVEIPGKTAYPSVTNRHAATGNGCIDCHMTESVGVTIGGHTMKVAYESGDATVFATEGCVGCHKDTEALNITFKEYTASIDDLMAQIKIKLVEKEVLGEDDYAVQGATTGKLASALLNYKTILEDRSKGLHNPSYVKAILSNTLESLQ
jgi:formate-dependent nitrite reductase cytochrome c552 subunit